MSRDCPLAATALSRPEPPLSWEQWRAQTLSYLDDRPSAGDDSIERLKADLAAGLI